MQHLHFIGDAVEQSVTILTHWCHIAAHHRIAERAGGQHEIATAATETEKYTPICISTRFNFTIW